MATKLPKVREELVALLQEEEMRAKRALYLVPLLDDEKLLWLVDLMTQRELHSFFMQCFALAVYKRRKELGEVVKDLKKVSEAKLSRTSAYELAELWDSLHPSWEKYYQGIEDLPPEKLHERLSNMLDNPPFPLIFEELPMLKVSHFRYSLLAPPEKRREMLKLAQDKGLSTGEFRRLLKESFIPKEEYPLQEEYLLFKRELSKGLELIEEQLKRARGEKVVENLKKAWQYLDELAEPFTKFGEKLAQILEQEGEEKVHWS